MAARKKVPPMSTKAWAKLAAKLMEEAAGEFGSHGCNDMNLDEMGLTRAEQEYLVRYMNAKNGSPQDTDDQIRHLPDTSDFCVMYAVAAWLRELATQGPSATPGDASKGET